MAVANSHVVAFAHHDSVQRADEEATETAPRLEAVPEKENGPGFRGRLLGE